MIEITGVIETTTDYGKSKKYKGVAVRHCDQSDFSQSAFTLKYYK